jgi:hypothetical protein
MPMKVKVETFSGYKADEYPRRIWIGGSCLEIMDIEDRWYGPGYSYFRVFADDGGTYILRQDSKKNEWDLNAAQKEAIDEWDDFGPEGSYSPN